MSNPEHTQRLAIINGICALPDDTVAAMKRIREIFSAGAYAFYTEAIKPKYDLKVIQEVFARTQAEYMRLAFSIHKHDLRSVNCVGTYLQTATQHVMAIPAGAPFTDEMITTLLDVFQSMKNIGCDALILPYC